jgi:hypothetical protein
MRHAPLLMAGFVSLALTTTAIAQDARRTAEPSTHYFIEFRARSGGLLGHTFIVYGRMDDRGRVLQERSAGLYPNDEYNESMLPAVMPVGAYVNFKKEDPSLGVSAVYRRRLTAAQYAHLLDTLRHLQKTERRWNLFFYNCNDFASRVARELGLWTFPGGLMRPNFFVHGLRALNRP